MAKQEDLFKNVVSHAKEYGFIFPSSEIYDGLSAVYDYAQNGVELKKNIREYWWKSMVQMNDNIVGLDAAILMHPTTWKASGHVDAFNDPLIDNKDSKRRYKADVLIEDYAEKLNLKAKKEIEKAKTRFGDAFNEQEFITTNARVVEYLAKEREILERMGRSLGAGDLEDVKALIEELEIACPESGSRNWTEVRQFNLMFGTKLGASADTAMDLYLRPETAQGIFVNFLNVQKSGRMKVPFGIAQTGKAFRNEIVARQFIFRMREFEQMEMQFFVRPGTQMEWYNYWKEERKKWHESIGIPAEKLRYHDHIKLAHYADAALDIEFEFPFGWKELEGIHSRTDFDLTQHQNYSKKKLQYFDNDLKEDGKPYGNYIPYVVETSVGLDRLFLTIISLAYAEEKWTKEDGTEDSRVVLRIPAKIAPTKLAILPLLKKDGLPEIAKQLMDDCKSSFMCFYEEKDAIGKRYRRMDAIGTPFCVTIDHQTKEDNTVTIRYRDDMSQQRIRLDEVKNLVLSKI